jgi:hypothetical protein
MGLDVKIIVMQTFCFLFLCHIFGITRQSFIFLLHLLLGYMLCKFTCLLEMGVTSCGTTLAMDIILLLLLCHHHHHHPIATTVVVNSYFL